MTEWLFSEVAPQAAYLENNWSCPPDLTRSQCGAFLLYTHYLLFSNGGRYDIKLNMQDITEQHAVTLCGSNGCEWVDYSAPGNILFGFLSAARGIPQPLSWFVGGLREQADLLEHGQPLNFTYAPSLLDNPGDKAAVDTGYALYNRFGVDITWAEFQSALTPDVLDSFQPPAAYPAELPLPQPNQYPPGFFLNQ